MPREIVGSCGIGQLPNDEQQVSAELALGVKYLELVCPLPEGYRYEIGWFDHDLGSYRQIVVSWEEPFRAAPWEHIEDAQEALSRFDAAVNWVAIEPRQEADTDDQDEEEPEELGVNSEISGVSREPDQKVAPDPDPIIELYRREELLELQPSDWQMALLIFKEMGWTPERPIESYANPLSFVKNYEGKAMHHAGQALFAVIKDEPIVSASVQMDLGVFYLISEFAGGGAFIVGRKGAYAEAKRDGDL